MERSLLCAQLRFQRGTLLDLLFVLLLVALVDKPLQLLDVRQLLRLAIPLQLRLKHTIIGHFCNDLVHHLVYLLCPKRVLQTTAALQVLLNGLVRGRNARQAERQAAPLQRVCHQHESLNELLDELVALFVLRMKLPLHTHLVNEV